MTEDYALAARTPNHVYRVEYIDGFHFQAIAKKFKIMEDEKVS